MQADALPFKSHSQPPQIIYYPLSHTQEERTPKSAQRAWSKLPSILRQLGQLNSQTQEHPHANIRDHRVTPVSSGGFAKQAKLGACVTTLHNDTFKLKYYYDYPGLSKTLEHFLQFDQSSSGSGLMFFAV